MNEIQTARTPEQIGSEIRELTNRAKSVTLWFGIEIGRRLCEAKELIGHGGWLDYLKNETEFSQSTANRFMTVFKEYGAEQITIFGAVSNYPTLNNLSISNALRLLALPAEEREDFAAENDAEHLSARELEKLIKEKEEALSRANAAETALAEADEGAARAEAELKERLSEAEDKARLAAEKAREMKSQLLDAQNEEAKLRKELKELEERPVPVAVDETAVENARQETEAKYQKIIDTNKKKLDKLKLAAESAEAEKEKAQAELAELKKETQLKRPDVAVFNTLFETVQNDFNRLNGCLIKIRGSEPETAEKLKAAALALLGKMTERLSE